MTRMHVIHSLSCIKAQDMGKTIKKRKKGLTGCPNHYFEARGDVGAVLAGLGYLVIELTVQASLQPKPNL